MSLTPLKGRGLIPPRRRRPAAAACKLPYYRRTGASVGETHYVHESFRITYFLVESDPMVDKPNTNNPMGDKSNTKCLFHQQHFTYIYYDDTYLDLLLSILLSFHFINFIYVCKINILYIFIHIPSY